MNSHKQMGVTLVELMITIGIVAVLLVIAVPSFQGYIGTQRLRSASADIVSSLNIARSEAVKRNVNVTVSTGSTWEDGWAIAVSGGGAPIRSYDAIDGVTYSVKDGDDNDVTSLEYGNDGRLTGDTVSFEVDNDPSVSGVSARCVEVSLSGKPKTDKGACS